MTDLTLRPDQMADLVFLMRNPKALLLHEPGCGKTPTVCVKIYARWKEGKKTVWVMPKSLLKKNKDELLRWTPLKDEQVVIVDGPKSKALLAHPAGVVFLMGPDRFRLVEPLLPKAVGAFDVDEFHLCYQGAQSARVKAWLKRAGKKDAEFVVMTGTLINGRLDSAWAPIHAIEPKYYPMGYDQFLNHHAVCDEYNRPVAWRNHKRLQQIIGKHGIRRLFKDIFGKQQVVLQLEDDIEMSPEQLRLFEELEETAVVQLESAMIDGTQPGVALIRARQIMEHPEAFPDPEGGGTINLLPEGEVSGKEERLRIHLEDHKRSGEPFVIFAALGAQQRRIAEVCREMGFRIGELNRHKTAPQRAKIDEDFQAGLLDGVVSSDKLAGVGYNWMDINGQELSHIIFASLGYLDGDFIQAIRRAIRKARKSPLRVTVLSYANNRVETKQRGLIERKSVEANKVDPTRPIIKFKGGGHELSL